MLFTRTYRYSSSMPKEDIKNRLLGKHVTVHNLDFEVSEKDNMIRIIPHAESIENIKTLPITHVEFRANGKENQTQVVISSKMRKIDKGGPMIIFSFCLFMLLAAVLMFMYGGEGFNTTYTIPMLSIGAVIFIIFWLKLESGYFDYIRKIRDYVKTQSQN